MTHYECLRVDPSASIEEIRAAYRQAARDAHPDRHGDLSAERMASVNEAWSVLGDPERRRSYDAELRDTQLRDTQRRDAGPWATHASPVGSAGGASLADLRRHARYAGQDEPARFPWGLMFVMATIGITIVLLGVIFADEPKPIAPDNILRTGDCVTLSVALEAAEVSCVGPYDATVQVLVAFDQTCPTGTESYRDRQGMGNACVIRVVP